MIAISYNEMNFLTQMESEIPGLLDNFNEAAKIEPENRFAWANQKLSSVYRDGWFVNTPVGECGEAESDAEHIEHLEELIERYYPLDMQASMRGLARIHDIQEAIAHAKINGIRRDLNPRFNKSAYKISDEDKERIEANAIRVILESEPEKMNIWREYSQKTSHASIEFGGLDKLCVMWKCVSYVESRRYKYPDFQRYWDYWPVEKAKEKLPPILANAFEQDLWPKIQRLKIV